MSITPVYLSIKTLDFPCYAGLPVCFGAYLELLSIQYPEQLHIIQVDNAPAHIKSGSTGLV
jgi:hypothetical protein